MATTHDLDDLKRQMEERTAHLRESFGVVETELGKLDQFADQFKFESLEQHQHDDNDIKTLGKDIHAKWDALIAADGEQRKHVEANFQHLQEQCTEAAATLDNHHEAHNAAHATLVDHAQVVSGNLEQISHDLDHEHQQYAQHVQDMQHTLSDALQKLIGHAGDLHQSVTGKQTEILTKAFQDAHAKIDEHLQGHLPKTFEEATSTIVANIKTLGEHSKTTSDTVHNELAAALQDIQHFAQQDFHDKVDAKFHHVMEVALAFLLAEVAQTILVTTMGVTTTAALSPIIPEAIVISKMLDVIEDAIKVAQALSLDFL